jgi:hypothetical protein
LNGLEFLVWEHEFLMLWCFGVLGENSEDMGFWVLLNDSRVSVVLEFLNDAEFLVRIAKTRFLCFFNDSRVSVILEFLEF